MRKTIYTIILILFCATLSQAQTLIPKAGLTLSTSNTKFPEATRYVGSGGDISVSSRTGFTVGVAYNIPVGSGSFSLQPELAFIQKGFKVKGKGTLPLGDGITADVDVKQELTINYIELPLLAKYEFGSDNARFSVYAGPSLGFGLGGKTKGTAIVVDDFGTEEYDLDADIKFKEEPEDSEPDDFNVYFDNRLDFGIQSGIGVTIAKKVAIDVRYGLGLTNLSDDHDSANRVFQFTVGVPILLKK